MSRYIIGTTNLSTKEIYLDAADALIHEIGHYYMYNSDINVSDIEVAYNNESKNLIGVLNEYGLSTYDEYFAELYKYYINNKDNIDLLCRINELAPDTYKILNKSLSKYWDVD